MTQWIELSRDAAAQAERYLDQVRDALAARVLTGEAIEPEKLLANQHFVHGFAWMAATVAALRSSCDWAARSTAVGAFQHLDELVLRIGFGEYLAQLVHGIPMSQSEVMRPMSLDLADAASEFADQSSVRSFLQMGSTSATRKELVELLKSGSRPCETLSDEFDLIREQFRSFTANKITPHAQKWHLADDLIPDGVIEEMAKLGVFGVCIPDEFGGLGLGKLAMALVSEELSRGWICAGSLGTRSEIAGELISANGTDAQKAKFLPRIADGSILPTAVFTEPDVGSDLASVKTRAVLEGEVWKVTGSKTWITHASRADLMTLLVRSEPDQSGYGGLSMLLAEKSRGTKDVSFPDEGLDGSEIEVLGYRGMKEYALSFDQFEVTGDNLLGGVRGAGFKQLMQTFEGARIQTAARAVGVAWNAFDLAFAYANDRKQFGKSLAHFPRVSDKLALMVSEIVMSRELVYFAAREKDRGNRCDIEAGMAKLLAARTAWSAADNAVQIHGGNGYALEFPISRVLCDARILNIFEGAGEIQADIIARGLLGRRASG